MRHHYGVKAVTVAERPELSEPAWELTRDLFPEYNNHGDVLNRYWSGLIEDLPEFQFHVVGDEGKILARARRSLCAGTAPSPTYRQESTAPSHAASTRAARTLCARLC